MHEAHNYPDLITQKINNFIDEKQNSLRDLGDEIEPLINETTKFLQGGKRLRGQFLINGYEAIQPLQNDNRENTALKTLLLAASALEVFHAAALIHDDIIDKSETRRGMPAIHERFKNFHEENNFLGDSYHFGSSIALLSGDLLQSWADELMNEALTLTPKPENTTAARRVFNNMRTEVAAGQYLDILEEVRTSFAEHQLQLERSTRVLIYKSAKYSVQAPLLLGATIAGANKKDYRSLSDFGLPIGVAFQLRDDLLGVFGESEITGKPSGDDLREGKRTILVTLARAKLPAGPKNIFDNLLGTPDLDSEQIKTLQYTIEDTGARSQVEEMITKNVGLARQALHDSDLHPEATTKLLKLADKATERNF